MAPNKTLAMKFLEGKKVRYQAFSYPSHLRDAVEVAQAVNFPPAQVFKTLVVPRPGPGKALLALVPAPRQLDLKKLAKAVGEKKLKMATQHEAEQLTGLQVGGISPLALLNRGFEVVMDASAGDLEQIVISAGERGQQIRMARVDFVQLTRARLADIAAGPLNLSVNQDY